MGGMGALAVGGVLAFAAALFGVWGVTARRRYRQVVEAALNHRDPSVRLGALHMVSRRGFEGHVDMLTWRRTVETDPAVLARLEPMLWNLPPRIVTPADRGAGGQPGPAVPDGSPPASSRPGAR